MPINRKSVGHTLICIMLVIIAGALRAVLRNTAINYNGIVSLIYLAVCFQWILSIRKRFLQKEMRKDLTAAAALTIFWIVIRFIKYEYVLLDTSLNRYLWYLYYIPNILLPLLMFLAVLHVGKTDDAAVSKYCLLLFASAAVIIIGVLTNDFHQQAFRFRRGFVNWYSDYTYGPFYYMAVIFFGFCLLGMLVVAFGMCAKKRFIKNIWLPLIVLAVAVIYSISYVSTDENKMLLQRMYEMPEFMCIFLIAFWESLVLTHMIPSNTNHERFFQASSIHAGITDNDYNIRLKASLPIVPTTENIKAAERGAVYLNNGDLLLKSNPVQGGHFYWTEDVSLLNQLNRDLMDTRDYLVEENAMLEESSKLEESRKRVEEQNRLYDQISQTIKPQLDTLDDLIGHLPDDETEFRQTMKYAAVLNVYVKRRSNLLLLAGTQDKISSDEFGISIKESLEYVSLCDVECYSEISCGHELPSEIVLLMYELFENALEEALPDTSAVLVTMRLSGGQLVFYMEFGTPTGEVANDTLQKRASVLGGRLEVQLSDDTEFVTFTVDVGGDEL